MKLKRAAYWTVTIILFLWAVLVTIMLLHNPLPFPDTGHRVFGVPDDRARRTVVSVIEKLGGPAPHFTFDSGAVHQTILWDNHTSIHYLDPEVKKSRNIPGNALSIPTDDPLAAAKMAVELLQKEGYKATIIEGIELDLPPNYLVPVESDAFDGWLMVFRRPLIKMPMPKRRASAI